MGRFSPAALVRGRRYPIVVGALLLVAAANLWLFRADLAAIPGALRGSDAATARWQAWARHYDRLFGMLPWGKPVGIQVGGERSAGVTLERGADGVTAKRWLFLRRADPGLVLHVDAAAAEQLLATAPNTAPEAIWQLMKDRLYAHQISVWSDPDLDRLERDGYLALMRAIDTRPSNVDWPTVQARLEGPPPAPLKLPDDRAGAIVRRAIEHAGGWERWAKLETVTFTKTVERYRDDGGLEVRRVQRHRYLLRPQMKARLEWEEDGHQIVMINNGWHAWKLVDGVSRPSEADRNSARNNTFGSHYVFNMPWKLADPGTHLADAGTVTLPGGTRADAVRVTYDKGAGDAGALHTWTYYFDVDSGRLVANLLQYDAERWDYTEYLDEQPVGGFLLPLGRYGYDADANGRKGPRKNQITYSGIRFDVGLAADLFDPPPGATD